MCSISYGGKDFDTEPNPAHEFNYFLTNISNFAVCDGRWLLETAERAFTKLYSLPEVFILFPQKSMAWQVGWQIVSQFRWKNSLPLSFCHGKINQNQFESTFSPSADLTIRPCITCHYQATIFPPCDVTERRHFPANQRARLRPFERVRSRHWKKSLSLHMCVRNPAVKYGYDQMWAIFVKTGA